MRPHRLWCTPRPLQWLRAHAREACGLAQLVWACRLVLLLLQAGAPPPLRLLKRLPRLHPPLSPHPPQTLRRRPRTPAPL